MINVLTKKIYNTYSTNVKELRKDQETRYPERIRQIVLDGCCYYVKDVSMDRLINELLSYLIAKKSNLLTPDLRIGITEKRKVKLLSKSFDEDGKHFYSGATINPYQYGYLNRFNTVEDYEKFLDEIDIPNAEIVLLETLKMGIFDAFRQEQDRSSYNFYFTDNYKKLILIDHSESFFGKTSYFVKNDLFRFSKESDTLLPYLRRYKELRELVQYYQNFDMDQVLTELEQTYPILLSDTTKEYYKKEVEGPKKVFTKWLNKM